MSNLLEVSSPLWLVVAAFALPFILGNFSLILSNLRNALQRKKQKSARETATSLFSVGKTVGMGVMFAGFLLATPPETTRSAEPTITDAYITLPIRIITPKSATYISMLSKRYGQGEKFIVNHSTARFGP